MKGVRIQVVLGYWYNDESTNNICRGNDIKAHKKHRQTVRMKEQ